MDTNDTDLTIRRRPTIKTIVEELKFIKSIEDVDILFQKAAFVFPRLTGKVDRWTAVPPSLQIEPTNSCNLMCVTCGRTTSPRKVGFMDLELFRKIIDDAAEIGVKRVQLFLMGEPLLHPRILDMIRIVKSKGIGLHLTTNGMLLNEKISDGILDAGVTSADYLTVSILGFSKDTHETVMRGVNHEKVMFNVFRFMEKRKQLHVNGPIVETVFYSIPENRHELDPFIKFWSNKVDHVIDGGEAVEAFIDQAIPSKPRTKTCTITWERMAIQWNGDVVMCSEDMDGAYKIGNLNHSAIKELWQSEKMTYYKQLHKEGRFGEIPLCKYCDW